jgi:hemoglobin/transferrin/lactoferrin receptor protein
MRRFYLTILMSFLYIIVNCQIIKVKDKETGNPVEMVTISSSNSTKYLITNSKGETDISAFKDDPKIHFGLIGYKSITISYNELEKNGFVIQITPTSFTLDKMVVSATRWSQSSDDIPTKITTITSKEIALQNPQTAADLLGTSGEVFIQKSQQGGGSPMIRGFSTNRLLYTIDGVRMNTAIFRSGNLQNVISLDPFATEKTEVFFGPGSVIYGSDAIGGVMSFQTITPQLSTNEKPLISGKAVSRYSSANNEKTTHFDVNLGWKKWALVSSFTTNDFGDLKMGSYGPGEYLRPFYVQRQDSVDVIITNPDPKIQIPSGYTQINMMQKIRFKPSENWNFEYGFHYSETSSYSRYDRHIRYKNGLPRYGEWYYGPQKWMMNNLSITNSKQKPIYDQFTIRLAQQSFEESRISRDINKPNREIRLEEVGAYSANFDFIKSNQKKNTLFYGVEAVVNEITSKGTNRDISTGISQPGATRYPQSTWSSFAAYISDQYKFSDKFLIQAGARYNQFMIDAVFDTTFYPFPFTTANLNTGAVTGSFGVVYKPTDKWVISTNLATGFRAPNVDDMGKVFDSEPGAVVVPNPDLEAEYVYNGDLGIAKIFGESVKIDFTAYYSLLQNALVRRNYILNGMDSIMYDGELSQVQAIQNAAVTTVYGLQAGIEIKLPSHFTLSSNFNYQVGEEELDDGTKSPSKHAAPWFGNTRLTYSYQNLSLQLYCIYNGERPFEDMPEEEKGKTEIYATDENGNPYSPGWYTLNFKAMYQFTNHFTVSAGIENITDERYRPYSSGLVAAGRNIVISLKAAF